MIQGKGYRKIVSSAEMRRIAEQQRREEAEALRVVLYGSEDERRAQGERNLKSVAPVSWRPGM